MGETMRVLSLQIIGCLSFIWTFNSFQTVRQHKYYFLVTKSTFIGYSADPKLTLQWLFYLCIYHELTWTFFNHYIESVGQNHFNPCVAVFFVFLEFDFCRFCVVIRVFSSPPQRPMTSDFEDVLSQMLSITFIFLS